MARLLQIPGDEPETVRDRAIMELLYSSGLRLAELISLDLRDVDLQELRDVTGKGNKTRIVPVGRKALDGAAAWLKVRARTGQARRCRPVRGSAGRAALSPRSVQARLKRWGIAQGVQQGVYPHLFRHSFASHRAGIQRRPARGAGTPGPRQHQHHPDLHPPRLPASGQDIYDAAHPRAHKKK